MNQPNVLVYGSMTCPDTTRARDFLDARGVSYEFKDVDSTPEFNDYVAGLNGGKRVIPTVRLNNHTFINPSDAELSQALAAD